MSVCVLLSSYQGEKYIEEQIESVLSQTYGDIRLCIRDDGSSDNTRSIIARYRSNKKVHILEGDNIGVTQSFWSLVRSASDADYYAFCDQDDVWFKTKLERATQVIGISNLPILYVGNVCLADEKLNLLKRDAGLLNADEFIPQNSILPRGDRVLGCTMVWNRALQRIIQEKKLNAYYAHDQQIFFLASMIGQVVFDSQPHMYYRQHSNNVAATGTTFGKLRQYRKRLCSATRRIFSKGGDVAHEIENRNRELLDACRDMIPRKYVELLELSCKANGSIRDRIILLKQECCNGLSIRIKIRILLGKL